MPVAAPADKRFRRSQVAPARRRNLRRSWRALVPAAVLVLGAGYAVYRGLGLVTSAPALRVTSVSVSGQARMALGDVLALTNELEGANIVTVDLEAWRERLLRLPWIESAAMRRVLPGTVQVFISERRPIGIGRLGDDLYLVDSSGVVIDEFGPPYAELDLPIIDGLGAGNREGGAVDAARAVLAGRLLAELDGRPDLARRISQIDVSDVRDAAVTFKGDTTVVRVGDSAFAERLESYLELAPALNERVQEIDYVDLRFDERVYVKPRTSRPAVRPAARSPVAGRVARR
jgi:cell division protein FtsQ